MSIANDIVNHPEYIRKLRQKGGEAVAAQAAVAGFEPSVDVGLFEYPEWEAGKAYTVNELFVHEGKPGFARSMHTAQAHYPPFSVGTESLYGARPRQRPDGTYPYVYNMKAEVDMRIQSAKDSKIYVCIQPADPLLYDPADVPAHFTVE